MAKEELFHSWLFSPLMYLAEAFPVRRGGGNEEREKAIQRAIEVLKRELVLGMFPEGRRSRSGQLLRGYPGAAIIALRSGAPLIPVAITGTEKLKGIGWLKRPKVTIKFGLPFRLPEVKGELTKTDLEALTNGIMKKIAILLPVEYRGEYKGVGNGD